MELLFSAGLAHRARLKAQRLDDSLKTATDWQKMFADMTQDIRFRPSASPVEVLLSGEEWSTQRYHRCRIHSRKN